MSTGIDSTIGETETGRRRSEGSVDEEGREISLTVKELRAGYRDPSGVNPFQYDVIIHGVDLEAAAGEIIGIQGPNASGKSTLLSAIVDPKRRLSGSVQCGNSNLETGMTAYVPQSPAETLSPWLEVQEEIALPMRVRDLPKTERRHRVEELMSRHGIDLPFGRRVSALSGGQRVKVALLRSFAVPDMKLFVLDEPFEGLDVQTRGVLIDTIRSVALQGIPVLITSHREEDLHSVGARIVRLEGSPVDRLVPVSKPDQDSRASFSQREETPLESSSEDVLSKTSKQSESDSSGTFGILRAFGIAAGLVVWELLAEAVGDPGLLPGPLSVGQASIDLLTNPGRAAHFFATMAPASSGWLIANAIAVPVGILLGYDERIYSTVSPWLSLGRTLPVFMLVAPAIGLFPGFRELQRGFLIWLTIFLISLQAVSAASAFAPRVRVRIARIYGASHWFRLTRVMPYETLSGIFGALEVTLPLSVIVALVVEIFLIPQTGLGIYIYNHLTDADLSVLFAHILLPGLAAAIGMWALRRWGSKQNVTQS